MFFEYIKKIIDVETIVGVDFCENHTNLIKIKRKSIYNDILEIESFENKQYLFDNFPNKLKSNNQRFVIALKDRDILSSEIKLDSALSFSEIKKYIFENSKAILGEYFENLCIDFSVISDFASVSESRIETPIKKAIKRREVCCKNIVKIFAAKRELISSILENAKKNKINLVAIDIESIALKRVLLSIKKEELIIGINSKDKFLLFCFIKNNQIVSTKEVLINKNINEIILEEIKSFYIKFETHGKEAHIFLCGDNIINTFDISSLEDSIESKIKITFANTAVLKNTKKIIASSFFLTYGVSLWNYKND